MTTALATVPAPGTALGPVAFTQEQADLLRRSLCPEASNDELALFLRVCERTQLDPFAKQIYAIMRYKKDAGRKVLTPQVAVDGFRLVAQRTGEYEGQVGPLWCGPDGTWRDIWLEKKPPSAAKVGVWRKGFKEPIIAVATWDAYQQGGPMWDKMGPLMLGKCAESLALRRAFPMELSGLYTNEEMAQADGPAAEPSYTPPTETTPPKWTAGTENAPKREVIRGFTEDPVEEDNVSARYAEEVDIYDLDTGEVKRKEAKLTGGQNSKIHALLRDVRNQYDDARYRKDLMKVFGKQHTDQLSVREAGRVIDTLEKRRAKVAPELEAQEAEHEIARQRELEKHEQAVKAAAATAPRERQPGED